MNGLIRIIIFIGLAIIFYQLFKLILNKPEKPLSQKHKSYIIIISVALAFALHTIVGFYGPKIPGHLFERNEYETMLYVRLYPNENEVKSYKVPAKIRRIVTSDCYPADNDTGQACDSWKAYLIYYAIMPNGGKIVFELDSQESLELNKIVWIDDEEGRNWGVELTKEAPE